MHDKSYKQIVILSGKGGTGKTTLTAAFSSLTNNKVIIDCDVDAANLHLILKPELIKSYEFFGGKKASIDRDRCSECGLCETVCRFDAIKNFTVDLIRCEGCGFCMNVCPAGAVIFNTVKSGSYFECRLLDESLFYYAKLLPGEGNSGKLVSEIKRKAIENIPEDTGWIIVDGPPGIGCPVNASMASADYAVIVTEPTVSGVHDLKRLISLLNTLKIRCGIVINKFDLNESVASEIFGYAKSKEIPVLGALPFDRKFVDALISGRNIVDIDDNIRKEFLKILENIESQINISVN